MYTLIQYKGYKSNFQKIICRNFVFFILLPAFYLITYVSHESSKEFKKKYPFWKFESWFPSELSQLTLAQWWIFRHEKKSILTNIVS
jgi:hypothetical protein